MKKILLSLLIVSIALIGIFAVSASDDVDSSNVDDSLTIPVDFSVANSDESVVSDSFSSDFKCCDGFGQTMPDGHGSHTIKPQSGI